MFYEYVGTYTYQIVYAVHTYLGKAERIIQCSIILIYIIELFKYVPTCICIMYYVWYIIISFKLGTYYKYNIT